MKLTLTARPERIFQDRVAGVHFENLHPLWPPLLSVNRRIMKPELQSDVGFQLELINGFLSDGKRANVWTVHPIEHELSAFYDITHGVGPAILTPRWDAARSQ